MALLGRVAASKPANPDMYSTHLAEFVETFVRVLGDPALPHLFFVEGGALAVENALKAAFDWKSRRNEAAGRSRDLGTKVLHLTHAFHGRSGYTMSLTNTDPTKTDRFPTFGWPRIDTPAVTFPIDEHLGEIEAAEARALAQAQGGVRGQPARHRLLHRRADPGRGRRQPPAPRVPAGDAGAVPHLRRAVRPRRGADRRRAHRHALGSTSSSVSSPTSSRSPRRCRSAASWPAAAIDEVPDNVFQVSSRINSTWGGGLVDMVRSRRLLGDHRGRRACSTTPRSSARLLPATSCATSATGTPSSSRNVRGRGLMCALDLPRHRRLRDRVITGLREEQRDRARLRRARRSASAPPCQCHDGRARQSGGAPSTDVLDRPRRRCTQQMTSTR